MNAKLGVKGRMSVDMIGSGGGREVVASVDVGISPSELEAVIVSRTGLVVANSILVDVVKVSVYNGKKDMYVVESSTVIEEKGFDLLDPNVVYKNELPIVGKP
jgi:hypothetical protein